MKRVKVRSLSDAFDYVTDGFEKDTLAIISIQKSADGGYGFRFIENSRCKGVLTLLFDDIEKPVNGLALFSEQQAQQIIDFVLAHRHDADTLLVHCYAGQSRSRAVGAFALRMLGGDNSEYLRSGLHNRHVYDTLMRVWEQRRLAEVAENDSM